MRRLTLASQLFVIAVILAASILLWILAPQVNWEAWPELLLFLILIGLATMFPIPDPRGGFMTATPILFYMLFTVYGPGAGIVIGTSAKAVGEAVSRGWLPWRTLFNGAQMGISACLGGLVFKLAGGSFANPDIRSFLLPFTFAALTHHLSNNFFVAFWTSRQRSLPFLPKWISDIKDLLWSNALGIASAALLAILYVAFHPGVVLIYLASLPLQRWALQLYMQQKRTYTQAIDALVVAIDSDFPEGQGHSRQIAETAKAIGGQLHLGQEQLETIEMGALLHDIGMIGLDEVRRDSSGGSSVHSEQLQEHARLGAEVARRLPRHGQQVADIILHHHENYDGSGYPSGLKGERIPLGARIVGLAEAYASMLAGAKSEGSLSPVQAIQLVKEQAGRMFDPRIVEAFLLALDQEAVARGSGAVDTTRRVPESGATGS